MVTDEQVEFYHENGFIVVEGVLAPAGKFEHLVQVTDQMVEPARGLSTHDDVYDLEDSHSAGRSRGCAASRRRTCTTRLTARLVRHPRIVAMLQDLSAPDIRFDTAKLNMKSRRLRRGRSSGTRTGRSIRTPTTTSRRRRDDGRLRDWRTARCWSIPGSHRGPVLDHHADGALLRRHGPRAAGDRLRRGRAAAPARPARSPSTTCAPCTARPPTPRPSSAACCCYQFRAADAWPLLGFPDGLAKFDELMAAGTPSIEPRLAAVPVRLPLPPADTAGLDLREPALDEPALLPGPGGAREDGGLVIAPSKAAILRGGEPPERLNFWL